ncbi:uncharacterized protein LOC109826692 [Asparagus officinalis]|uniref:uncharacterized protein LOC109826692 n=1 Tax=Asparagus officinalis TaxID=4686 RepID=UPI00098E5DD5|nr:uncharacterized protein LOC109826692 [Asparagus officinalis]
MRSDHKVVVDESEKPVTSEKEHSSEKVERYVAPTSYKPPLPFPQRINTIDMVVRDDFTRCISSDLLEKCLVVSVDTVVSKSSRNSPEQVCEGKTAPKVELKPLPSSLKYEFLDANGEYPVIVNADLSHQEVEKLLKVLRLHKDAIGYFIDDIKSINPSICMHRIFLEEGYKTSIEHQRRLNPNMKEVVRKEVLKVLDAGIIYPISYSEWVSPVQVVPKKGGMTIDKKEKNELIPTRTVTGWHICIDYQKLNKATRKDHFPLPFIDQMLERLARHSYFCYLDGYSGFFQIPIHPSDQEKTIFTCPYGTFAYRRMSFGLCNTPVTFQRCMMVIFFNFIENIMEVFMDDFLVYGISFDYCLHNLAKILKRCKEMNLVLNWEKCHFMWIPLTNVKGVRSFPGHVGLKEALTTTPVMRPLDWSIPFEIMCDASDYAIEDVLGQRKEGKIYTIYYASRTMDEEFDLEIKDKKGTDNVVADHLSRLRQEMDQVEGEKEPFDDSFPDDNLFAVTSLQAPWFADFVNYIAYGVLPSELSYQQHKKFLSDVKHYY